MLVPFVGYAQGRRFIGYVECRDDRLAEFLNRNDRIVLRDSFVENFADDIVTNLGDGELDRSTLYAVEAFAAGSYTSRRIPSAQHRLHVQLGPYSALGVLHTPPGQLPLPLLTTNGPMVTLSDATLGYACRGSLVLRDVGTLVINREFIDWVRASDEEAGAFPGVPVEPDRA